VLFPIVSWPKWHGHGHTNSFIHCIYNFLIHCTTSVVGKKLFKSSSTHWYPEEKNNGHSYLHYYTATTTYFLCSQQKKICAIVTDLFNFTDFIIATTQLSQKVQLEIIWKQSWLTMPKKLYAQNPARMPALLFWKLAINFISFKWRQAVIVENSHLHYKYFCTESLLQLTTILLVIMHTKVHKYWLKRSDNSLCLQFRHL